MLIYSRLPKATHGRVISRFFCDWTLQFVEVSDSERLGRCAWNPRWRGRWRTFRWSSLAGFDQKCSELKENHIDIADVDRFSDFRAVVRSETLRENFGRQDSDPSKAVTCSCRESQMDVPITWGSLLQPRRASRPSGARAVWGAKGDGKTCHGQISFRAMREDLWVQPYNLSIPFLFHLLDFASR